MAEGDVRLDDEYSFTAGTRVVLYAVESDGYPGGVNYRFAYVDSKTGTELLRYDNSRVPRHGVGVHHRHRGPTVTPVPYDGVEMHVSRFWSEVTDFRVRR